MPYKDKEKQKKFMQDWYKANRDALIKRSLAYNKANAEHIMNFLIVDL